MTEASLESQRNLSDSHEEVQGDMDESVSQSESCTDDTHMTEININDSSSDKKLSHERNGEDDEGHQDAVIQHCSSSDRVHTLTEENSDPRSDKVMLSTASVSAPFCFQLLWFQTSDSNLLYFINHC